MTIDKAIDIMEHYKEYGFISQKHGRNKAISIMRKYQKIEQIYREWFSDTGRTSADAYVRIGEVIEDGKID